MRTALPLALLLAFAVPAHAIEEPRHKIEDPLATGMWDQHQRTILADPLDIRFDERVKVHAPSSAEDPFQVPVLIDATAIPDIRRIVVFVEYGPIPPLLTYRPGEAEAKIGFRFKIDQATPIRAAVENGAGQWFVGHTLIDAAGGGCSAPAVAYAADDWMDRLGEVQGRIWAGEGRLRMVVDHPMDTGLADGIPRFIVEKLAVNDMDGSQLAEIELYEPVSEDPVFTLFFPKGRLSESVRISGRDNGGTIIDAVIGAAALQ